MNSGHDAHRRSVQMATYAKQTEYYQQGKEKAKQQLNENTSTLSARNAFFFEKVWKKWLKKKDY